MNLHLTTVSFSMIRIPRVSGDEPIEVEVDYKADAYSPRERG